MIKLYWCPWTRASRALWFMEETGLPFEVATIDIRDDAARNDPAFRAVSPQGKVPALEDGPVKMADSAALMMYVADRYPQTGLAPAIDDPLRGRYLYWMLFGPAVIEPAATEKREGWTPDHAAHGWGDHDSMVSVLTEAMEPGPWLLGERFSAADVMIGSSILFLVQFGMLPDLPAFRAYADRCAARPAYQKAQAREPKTG
jgi:glutathione S-transferase